MREAGRLGSEGEARTLSDYLLTEGIETRVDHDSREWVLWVYDDEALPKVRLELERFRADPNDRRYRSRAAKAQAIREEEARERERIRKMNVDLRARWSRREAGLQPVTTALIAISVIVGMVTRLELGHPGARIFLLWLPAVAEGQVWRLVTPIFLHGGLLHIVFNMLWLYSLGRVVEGRYGSWRFGALVLGMAVFSNVVQALMTGPGFGGMSGVVYGLLGFVYVKGQLDPRAGIAVPPSTMAFMMIWLALGLFGFMNMANGAHVGGLVSGAVAAAVPVLLRRR